MLLLKHKLHIIAWIRRTFVKVKKLLVKVKNNGFPCRAFDAYSLTYDWILESKTAKIFLLKIRRYEVLETVLFKNRTKKKKDYSFFFFLIYLVFTRFYCKEEIASFTKIKYEKRCNIAVRFSFSQRSAIFFPKRNLFL